MNVPIKGVIFDLDGTLINSIPDIHKSLNIVLRSNHLDMISLHDCEKMVGNGLHDLIHDVLPAERRNAVFIDRLVDEMRTVYSRHWMDAAHLYSGIEKLLDILIEQKIRLAVLSNKHERTTQMMVSQLLSKWKFLVVAGATDSRPLKPHPDAVHHVIARMNLDSNECIFVGDGETDVIAARQAGVLSSAVCWGYRSKELLSSLKPDFLIEHPLDLLDILK
jgi:phosphoglycolate phosphatase